MLLTDGTHMTVTDETHVMTTTQLENAVAEWAHLDDVKAQQRIKLGLTECLQCGRSDGLRGPEPLGPYLAVKCDCNYTHIVSALGLS